MVQPVAQTVGMGLVNLAYRNVYLETFVYLFFTDMRSADDAHGKDVVYLVEGDVLLAHLVPDGVGAFDAGFYLVVDAHLVEGGANGDRELVEQLVAFVLR